nr:MAG TPA: tail protein [Caudoviricetes sp.]
MAECILLKGGGADLDVVTAGANDVVSGKVIVDREGEPLPGTMPNRGAVTQSLGVNGTYAIPEGYHNGLGKVTQSVATMGGQIVNPTASQQTVSTSGKYMTGNVVVNGVSNLSAENIKKGASVGGVVGSWEGYVPTVNDLYLRGDNRAGFESYNSNSQKVSSYIRFDTGQITFTKASGAILLIASVNLTGYNYINLEGYLVGNGTEGPKLCVSWNDRKLRNTGQEALATGSGYKTLSLNISAINGVRYVMGYTYLDSDAYIYRIWLS